MNDIEFDFDAVCSDVAEAALLVNDAIAAGGELADGLTVDVLLWQIESNVRFALKYMDSSQRAELDQLLRDISGWESNFDKNLDDGRNPLYVRMGDSGALFHKFDKEILSKRALVNKSSRIERAMMVILARDFGIGRFVSQDDMEKLVEVFIGGEEIGVAWGRIFYGVSFGNREYEHAYFAKRVGWPFSIERKVSGDTLFCCLRMQ